MPGMPVWQPSVLPDGYLEVLDEYSRHQARYYGLERRLLWGATHEAWRFREARTAAFAHLRRLSDAERVDLLEHERVEAERYLDFFVAIWTERREWSDLASSRSMWRVELLPQQGNPLLPVRIEWLPRVNENVRALYPYLGDFSLAYRIRFLAKDAEGQPTVDPCAEWIALRISSGLAHGELIWPLEPDLSRCAK